MHTPQDQSPQNAGEQSVPVAGGEQFHVATSEAIDRYMETFRSNLLRRAEGCKFSRGSQMLADSDVEDAYWQICGTTSASRMARLVGDSCIGAGGILLGLVVNLVGMEQIPMAIVLGVTGVFLWVVGGYIREWLCAR